MSLLTREKKFLDQKIKPEIKQEKRDIKIIIKDLFKIRKRLRNNNLPQEELTSLIKDISVHKDDLNNQIKILLRCLHLLINFDFKLYKKFNFLLKIFLPSYAGNIKNK